MNKTNTSRNKTKNQKTTVSNKSRRGPAGKHNDTTVGRFLEAYKSMIPIRECCDYAGITERTFYNWKKSWKNGADDRPEIIHLFQEIREIDFKLQKELLKKIANDKSWKAQAWLLKIRWPECYSDIENIQITGKLESIDEKDESISLEGLSNSAIDEIANLIIDQRAKQKGMNIGTMV